MEATNEVDKKITCQMMKKRFQRKSRHDFDSGPPKLSEEELETLMVFPE